VNRYGTRGGFVAQLWHGIPLKKLHLDSPAALRVSFLPNHRLVRAVAARAYRFAGRGISLFPVASELVAPRIASAFGIPLERIVVTGDPRDDVLLRGSPAERRATALETLGESAGPRRILYAPTWRDGAADPAAPDDAEWSELTAWLERTGSELWIRTHPLGKGDYARGPALSSRIRMLGMDRIADVTPVLPAFDALITDYSSIAYDFALTGGPIVFLAPDVEAYAKTRGLYEAYRDFSGGRHVTSWSHVLTVLDERLTDRKHPGAHETWLRNEHFDHLDGAAARRVLDAILARTGGARAPELRGLPRPVVTRVEAGSTAITVTLSSEVEGVRLEGARASVEGRIEGSLVPGTTTATFGLLTTRWGEPGLALPTGDYRLTLGGVPPTTRVRVDTALPDPLRHELFHAVVEARAGGLVVRVTPPLASGERGARAQAALERAYRRARPTLEDAVFLESFYGQSASDNPYGIDRALEWLHPSTTRYWSVADGSVAIPEGGVRIIEGSREWWRVRGAARVLIVNDWLRKRFRRRAGQHVLQTWHGTMLKRLALDRSPGLRTRIAVLRERSRWNALLAQNPYSARIFRTAYAMRGPIWEDGYPRNDILRLADAERAVRTARVRAAVGVPDGARVVLYAPTWRDDRTEMVDYVDLTTFAGELGDDHVLLVRGHSRTLRYGQDLAGVRLVDVTSYPNMTDLLLLADVLVTDYSSVMFDFAGTGKPIVFFTPDLAHYSTDLRGFYFDLLAEAPGEVVHERDGLRDAILATREQAAGERASAWRERFTPHDDGLAGERVVRRMLDLGWLP
jgi:CDP-glycerol glycerophosphotransferase (TagB/SpsB family)